MAKFKIMKAKLKQIQPVLPVKDVSQSINYYVQKLGFKLAFMYNENDPKYAGIVRDGIEIHLQWHDEKEWLEGLERPMLRIVVDGIEALFEEYKSESVFHERTVLRETAWGTKEFAFYDLNMNGLTFYRDN